ncbi:MAG: VWA domain-containing protein [Rhodothermaceae bacterium]
MFRFAHSEYLLLLYILPIIAVLFWLALRKRKKVLDSFADQKMHSVLMPMKSTAKNIYKFVLVFISITLIIFSLANPQVGSKIEEVKQVGIDVFILLDVSLSMTAEDIKPNRLEKAKHDIAKLIHKLRGDRIGLIVFSGDAYVQFPLTTDYSAANLFLQAVDVSTVPQPGTNISEAISLARKSFKKESETSKAIVIITDGEDHEGKLAQIAEEVSGEGISVYAIGLGSPAGVPIPVYNKAGVKTGYKKDRKGNVVLTKLNEESLQKVTTAGKGKYYRGSNTEDELDLIYRDLSSFEQTEYGATKITEYEDRFYYLLAPALLLLFMEFFISLKKNKLFMKFENLNKN